MWGKKKKKMRALLYSLQLSDLHTLLNNPYSCAIIEKPSLEGNTNRC